MKLTTSLNTGKTFGLEFRERNYPTFEGRYNCYVEVYGELSGEFLGLIEEPIKSDCTQEEMPDILNMLPEFIKTSHSVSIW